MIKITIPCSCGEVFSYSLAHLDQLEREWAKSGVVPLIVPHKDHFITVYVDQQGNVRSIERVLLVSNQESSSVMKIVSDEELHALISEIRKEADPLDNYYKFISALLQKTNSSETLFKAGQLVGMRIWKKKRNTILKLGAKYNLVPELLMTSELKPILEMTGETKLSNGNSLQISRCVAPQFIVGLAQGILDAILDASGRSVQIRISYEILGDLVKLEFNKGN